MAMTDDQRLALCRVVGVMLVTDGQLTDEEYSYFNELMTRLEVPEDRRGEVTGAVSIDTDISGDVALLKAADLGDALIDELTAAAAVDGDESNVERSVLAQVEALLGA